MTPESKYCNNKPDRSNPVGVVIVLALAVFVGLLLFGPFGASLNETSAPSVDRKPLVVSSDRTVEGRSRSAE